MKRTYGDYVYFRGNLAEVSEERINKLKESIREAAVNHLNVMGVEVRPQDILLTVQQNYKSGVNGIVPEHLPGAEPIITISWRT